MSRLVSILLLAMLMFPLAAVVYFVVAFASSEWLLRSVRWPDRAQVMWPLAGVVTWAFMAGYWTLLWRRSVRWNHHRLRWTFLCALGAVAAAVPLGTLLAYIDEDVGYFVASVTAPLLWLVGVTLVWRETPDEQQQRRRFAGADSLVCPACGYAMTGLYESRCPECGVRYTLDELLASQPNRASLELESSHAPASPNATSHPLAALPIETAPRAGLLSYRAVQWIWTVGTAPKAIDAVMILAAAVLTFIAMSALIAVVFIGSARGVLIAAGVFLVSVALLAGLFWWSNHFRHRVAVSSDDIEEARASSQSPGQ